MRRTQEIAPLREESVRAAAAVLQACSSARHAEAHVRRPCFEADLGEEPHEIRVRAIVVHEKARVQRQGAGGWGLHHDRVRVTAEARLLLEQPHVVPSAVEVSVDDARASGYYDGVPFTS